MSRPRFLFVTGTLREGSPSPAWPDRSSALRGLTAEDGSWVSWRLAGANNRELGRSAQVYPDLLRCVEDAVAVIAGIARTQALLALNHVTGLWVWRLDLDERPVAVAARGHQRRRECEYSLSRFLAAVPDAAAPDVHAHPRTSRRGRVGVLGGTGAA
ncbi:MAG TPA: hypothetical protein VMI11_09925 [Actinomycetes bacterium]|nr:hypothetical protein [Actinomycetes bacterium]